MVKKFVGVDIGSEAIRAVEVTGAASARPTISLAHEVPLPEGAVKNGEVVEANTVASALRQLWGTAGFKTKDVILGVGNPKVLVRDLTVPKLGRDEIRESLPFHVQDLLPVPVADALLDFYPISESVADSGPVLHGLLVAAVKESVRANVAAVQLAGLSPVAVDLIPFALTRLVPAETTETVAVIDFGARTTNVVVMQGGVPQFVRIIHSGGADITAALAQTLEIAPEKAEGMKRSLGLSTSPQHLDQVAAIATIQQLASELLNSVRNTLGYYINTRPQSSIKRIVISGGGAQLTGFADALHEITRIRVVAGDPFSRFASSKSVAQLLPARRAAMSVALGLAMGHAA